LAINAAISALRESLVFQVFRNKKLLAPRGSQESLVPVMSAGTIMANPIAFEMVFRRIV
jgi:hypothetical protein